MSLSELVVALGISIVIAGVAGIAFMQGMKVYNRMFRGYNAESEMVSLMYALKSTFAQSVNMEYGGVVGAAANNYTLRSAAAGETTVGHLYRKTTNGNSGNPMLISLGVKESGVTDLQSRFSAFGVFFQEPLNDQSGVVYIDNERNDASGFAILSPINSIMAFSRLTEFEVDEVKVMNDNRNVTLATSAANEDSPIVSAVFRMVMRYYATGVPSDWRWCPAAMIAGTASCQTSAVFTDVEKRVKLVFSNNSLDKGNHLPERPFGKVYFFKSFAPTFRQ